MATILTKKKDTSGAPSAGDLTNDTGGAELAVNTADKRLYTKDSGGNVVEVGTNPSTINIDAGSIDGTPIGANSASTGSFTTLNTSGAVVFNDAGADVDFRVESDTVENALFVEGSSGNVGIGTTTGGKLHVAGSFSKNTADENTWGIRVTDETAMAAGVGGGIIFGGNYTSGGGKAAFASIAGAKTNATTSNGLGELKFYTTDVSSVLQERMRIDSSGNVGIDNTSPSTFGKLTINVPGTTTPTNATNVGPSSINLYAVTNGASTDCTTGIFGWNASQPGIGSGIGFSREDAGNWGTQIRFYTHPTTTSNISDVTERMRITSGGSLLVGATSGVGSRIFYVKASSGLQGYFDTDGANTQLTFGQSGGDKAYIFTDNANTRFYVQSGNSGGVYLADGGTSWTSASDERLKENLEPIENGLTKVASLRAVTGNYINDETKKSKAFLIAQDVQKILPQAVDASNPEELGLQYVDVIPLLVASIQELKAELDTVKAELATLKGA